MNQSRKSCAVLIALLVALIALFAGSLFFLVKIQLHKKSPKRSKPAAAETAVPAAKPAAQPALPPAAPQKPTRAATDENEVKNCFIEDGCVLGEVRTEADGSISGVGGFISRNADGERPAATAPAKPAQISVEDIQRAAQLPADALVLPDDLTQRIAKLLSLSPAELSPEDPLNALTRRQKLPLNLAAQMQHTYAVMKLLSWGANPNLTDANGYTPLQTAVASYAVEITRILLDAGADPNYVDPQTRQPVLSYALKHQYTQIVKPLLQYGANPNAPDQDGVLPLTEAARRRNHKNIAALLAAGADPNIVIPNAETPLHAAIRTTDVVPVADLLAAKADPNIVDGLSKKPALFAAIDVGSVNSVSVLLYAGADPRTKYNGQNALGYALTRQPQKDGVVAVLQHALRDPDFKNELPKHLPLITKSADVYFIKGAEPFERMD